MPTLLTILFCAVAAAVGVYCGWHKYLRRTSGPKDVLLVKRFLFHISVVALCFVVAFVLTPETYRDWLMIPLTTAELLIIIQFRKRRTEVQREEGYLDSHNRAQ